MHHIAFWGQVASGRVACGCVRPLYVCASFEVEVEEDNLGLCTLSRYVAWLSLHDGLLRGISDVCYPGQSFCAC